MVPPCALPTVCLAPATGRLHGFRAAELPGRPEMVHHHLQMQAASAAWEEGFGGLRRIGGMPQKVFGGHDSKIIQQLGMFALNSAYPWKILLPFRAFESGAGVV